MGRLDGAYRRLPVGAQHMAVSLYGLYWRRLRFGPGYSASVREYASREHWSDAEWRAWTQGRSAQILSIAAQDVPFYRDTWTSAERRAAMAGRLDDLPLLEKQPLRDDPRAFLRGGTYPRRPLVFHTSGSTGTPIATVWTALEMRRSMAVREVRSAGWAGVSFSLPRATFSGRMVVPEPNSPGPFHRFNLAERQVYFSAFHLRPETARAYVRALRRHRIQWLTGYAVSSYLLAREILDQHLDVPPLRAVITTSEKLTERMRSTIEEAFGCRAYEEYSTVENVLFASECEHGRLHVSPDIGLVEILRPDGSACEPGEAGEVVATCLLRELQPLVRFRLGDIAMWDEAPCPCGRNMPVIREVLGRIEDVVVGRDGRRMVRFHGLFIDQPRVREGQVVQETIDRIRVRVVPAAGFGQPDVDDIAGRVRQRLGPDIDVIVEPVSRIPRTAAGKFPAVVSLLRNRDGAAERTGLE
jgi:phenylacetate-coenzyme A ligase PaaK-like adenylate-forming protein